MSKPQLHHSMPEPAPIAWHWSKRTSANPPALLRADQVHREAVMVALLGRAAPEDEVPHGPSLPAPDHERGRAPALPAERDVRASERVRQVHVLAGEPVGGVLNADVAEDGHILGRPQVAVRGGVESGVPVEDAGREDHLLVRDGESLRKHGHVRLPVTDGIGCSALGR